MQQPPKRPLIWHFTVAFRGWSGLSAKNLDAVGVHPFGGRSLLSSLYTKIYMKLFEEFLQRGTCLSRDIECRHIVRENVRLVPGAEPRSSSRAPRCVADSDSTIFFLFFLLRSRWLLRLL